MQSRLKMFQHVMCEYRWHLVLLAFGSIIAYGFHAFNLTLAIDDWPSLIDSDIHEDQMVRNGRWLIVFHHRWFEQTTYSPAFYIFMYVVFYLAAAAIYVILMGIRDRVAIFMLLAVVLLHPFNADMISFNIGPAHTAVLLAAIAAYVGAVVIDRVHGRANYLLSGVYLLLAIIVLSLALSLYQPALYVTASALGFRFLYRLIKNELASPLTALLVYIAVIALILVGGYVLWRVEVEVSHVAFNVSPVGLDDPYSPRGGNISSLAEFQMTLRRFASHFYQYLFRPQHLIPGVAKSIFLVMLMLFFVRAWQSSSRAGNFSGVLAIAGIAALLFLPWSLGLVRVISPYGYRSLLGNIFVAACIVAILIDIEWNPLMRQGVIILSSVLLVIFMFQNNSASVLTYTNYERDAAIAARLVEAIETHPRFEILREATTVHVIVVGRLPATREGAFDHVPVRGPMSVSSLGCGPVVCSPDRLSSILNFFQSSDVNYWPPFSEEYRTMSAQRRLSFGSVLIEMEPWPHETSVQITDDAEVIIMFAEP
ncbi:MAG: glucosyltransferase domain-containing protein [Chloroflexota bacterium]